MSNLLHIPGARFVMTEQRWWYHVAGSFKVSTSNCASRVPSWCIQFTVAETLHPCRSLNCPERCATTEMKMERSLQRFGARGGWMLRPFLLSLGPWIRVNRCISTTLWNGVLLGSLVVKQNENLCWQGEKTKGGLHTRKFERERFRARSRFPIPFIPSPIYFLLFDWQLDKHTNVYLVRTKVYETKRANLTTQDLMFISLKGSQGIIRFVSWSRAG